jgi:hypothetical protein
MDNTLYKQPVGISKSEMPTQRWAFFFFPKPWCYFKKNFPWYPEDTWLGITVNKIK